MAGNLLQSISKDDFERARFLSKKKFANDWESSINSAKKEKTFEIAINMIKKGMDNNTISDLTGLTPKEIEDLRNKI